MSTTTEQCPVSAHDLLINLIHFTYYLKKYRVFIIHYCYKCHHAIFYRILDTKQVEKL